MDANLILIDDGTERAPPRWLKRSGIPKRPATSLD
jgi:hypothetical protein